jgi:DNA-binding response OmpR family regulator
MFLPKKGTILIIEDEPGFRRIYRDFLESEGFTVIDAADGEKGMYLIKTQKPDLVLLDLVVPNLNGFEILRKIREDAEIKSIPVIIFSVLGEKDTIKKGLEMGADDYAVKGFYSPAEMMGKINALLERSDEKRFKASYLLAISDGRGDSARFQQDLHLTKLFHCPHCDSMLMLELTRDTARTDGHWFTAHLVCSECKRAF